MNIVHYAGNMERMRTLNLATTLVVVSLLSTTAVADRTSTERVSAARAAPVYDSSGVGKYFREWLLCGPMPLGRGLVVTDYKHGPQCTGFHADLLATAGSEAGIDPQEGDVVTWEGQTFQWFRHTSKGNLIALDEIFSPNELVVGYGFCKIRAAKAGRVILSVGSNDGIKIWLNGRNVHTYHPEMGRWLQPDDDYVPIDLKAGLNNLLVKVDEGGGDYGYVVRLLDYEQTVTSIRKDIDRHKRLSVVTEEDAAFVYFGEPYAISVLNPNARVTVELFDQTRKCLAVQTARPGYRLTFPLVDVPDGPLTFRASFSVSQGPASKEPASKGPVGKESGSKRETLVSERGHFKGKLPRHPNVQNIVDLALLNDRGKPYLPVGMYGVPVSAYPQIKEAGVNFVLGSAASLDAAQAAGLKVGVGLHGSGPGWLDHIRETVKATKAHPALLFWMMFDEPGYNKADLLQIHAVYNALYESDKIHPAYLVITTPTVYKTFGRCCDVLAVDTYPVSRGDYASVPRAIERAYDASDGDQPIWHCGQLFAWPRDRPPTPHEHRYMTYSSLIAGAKAFLWYSYGHGGWTLPKDDPPLWRAHKSLLRQLADLASVIVAPGRGEKVSVTGGHDTVRAVIKSDGKRTFLFAASDARTETVRCTFALPTAEDVSLDVYGEERTVTAAHGMFTDTLGPLDVHIYQLP